MNSRIFTAVFLVCIAMPALSQLVPTATEGESPFSVGGGVSGTNPDVGHGLNFGTTLWADYKFNRSTSFLHGVGLEVVAHDYFVGHSTSQPSSLREDSFGGGLTYNWYKFHTFRPYAKALWEYGNAAYLPSSDAWSSQSRTVLGLGGGVEYHAFGKVWIRADYEYQTWPDFFKHSGSIPSGTLNPQSVTLGFTYHFGHKAPKN
jgi:opacity protein-like surface antigen